MATQYSASWIPRSSPGTPESKTSLIVLTTAQASLSSNSPQKILKGASLIISQISHQNDGVQEPEYLILMLLAPKAKIHLKVSP